MVELIAEIGQAHEGSLGILHSYIDALADTGVNTVKFQMHIADAESSEFEEFRVKFSYVDSTRYEYWKRMEFTLEQWYGIKKHCEDKNLNFLCSPFSIQAFEWCEKLCVNRYKIASGEITNYLLLDKIAETQKPVILSSGLSNFSELDLSIKRFSNYPNENISLLQCTTQYPTSPENIGINVIQQLLLQYPYKIGLSDHSGQIYPAFAALSLGATLIEFHVTFDKRMFGPDSSSSLDFKQINELVKGVRFLEKVFSNKVDKTQTNDKLLNLKKTFGKSLAVRVDKKAGSLITVDDLETKKPAGYGVPADEYQNVLGKRLIKDLKRMEFINYQDLSDD